VGNKAGLNEEGWPGPPGLMTDHLDNYGN